MASLAIQAWKEAVGPTVRTLFGSRQGHLIDGERTDSEDGRAFVTLDPSSASAIADVALGGPADIERAVSAARRALSGPWGSMLPRDRGRIIARFADLIEDHAVELAEIESLDNGKPIAVAKAVDLKNVIAHFRFCAGWPERINGEILPASINDIFCYTRNEPVGVCALIVPWNYPLLMAASKVAPALAAGCTVILKPAEETPLTALRLGELGLQAGLPNGVLNVVAGDATTGAALVDHPGVDKISFTGSTEVGREIGAKAGNTLKRVTLELGGKSANVILPDADFDAAVKGAFQAIYFNNGQSCNAGSRLFVPRERLDEVVSGLATVASATRMGPGFDQETVLGPVISEQQRDRVLRYVACGLDEGAELVTGGKAFGTTGYYVEPTLFSAKSNNLTIARDEIFGPVLVAQPYETFDEVVDRANESDYGLAAGVWTQNAGLAHEFARRVKAGTVYVNSWFASDPCAPFGGVKASGIGRERGLSGLRSFLEEKTVWMSLA